MVCTELFIVWEKDVIFMVNNKQVTVSDLRRTVADQETRLTAAEENIQGTTVTQCCNLTQTRTHTQTLMLV